MRSKRCSEVTSPREHTHLIPGDPLETCNTALSAMIAVMWFAARKDFGRSEAA